MAYTTLLLIRIVIVDLTAFVRSPSAEDIFLMEMAVFEETINQRPSNIMK